MLVFSTPRVCPAQGRPVRVRTAEVLQREVSRGHTFVGTVMPKRQSTVGSAVGDRVEEFLVDEGDEVDQGQPLARLRTRDLEIELTGAEAELELRQQELAELENGSRPEEIEQAKARVLAAEALKKYTAARLRRSESLYARNATSEDELQEVRSAAQGAEQRYLEAKAAWDLAVAGPRKEKIAQARARVQVQREVVNHLRDEIEEHTIRAPFHGYVTDEFTEVGQWIALGAPVVEIVDVDTVEIEIPVLERYISRVRVGMPARVTLDARPTRQWTAEVAAVVPKADRRSRSFPVKVALKNTSEGGGPVFQPGMFARVALSVGSAEPVLLVPKDAVVLGGRSPTVFVPEAADKSPGGPPAQGPPPSAAGGGPAHIARAVPVELGAAVEGMIEVRGALKPGDPVVVVGNERVTPGGPLIVVE